MRACQQVFGHDEAIILRDIAGDVWGLSLVTGEMK